MDPHFRCLMNTYDYEDALFRLDPKLKEFRNLKEKYIQFNNRNAGKPIEARKELDELIPMYQASEYEIFRNFGDLLENIRIILSIRLSWSKNMVMGKYMKADFQMVQ